MHSPWTTSCRNRVAAQIVSRTCVGAAFGATPISTRGPKGWIPGVVSGFPFSTPGPTTGRTIFAGVGIQHGSSAARPSAAPRSTPFASIGPPWCGPGELGHGTSCIHPKGSWRANRQPAGFGTIPWQWLPAVRIMGHSLPENGKGSSSYRETGQEPTQVPRPLRSTSDARMMARVTRCPFSWMSAKSVRTRSTIASHERAQL